MSIFNKIGNWIAKTFHNIKSSAAPITVAITAGINVALKSGIPDALAKIIEGAFPGVEHLPEVIIADLKIAIPKILVAELAVEGLPDAPTEADILAFEKRILDAFSVHDDKSKLYTTLGAQIYGIIRSHAGEAKITFAELVADVEAAYQDYLADMAENGM